MAASLCTSCSHIFLVLPESSLLLLLLLLLLRVVSTSAGVPTAV
jgi:hypothetical protein